MKVLLCCDSEIVLQVAGMALEAAGHQPVLARDPSALVAELAGAQALLVDAARARAAPALLREKGFAGRALLLCDGGGDHGPQARELGLDGALEVTPPEAIAQRLQALVGARRKRILIVDDSEIVARLLREELEAKGFEIQYAPDAEKATSIILKRQTRPDLILLDVNMPKVDGGQFCRFVKRNEMFRAIKVVFCTGEDRSKVEQLVRDCGADGYISKDEFLGKWIVDQG